MVVERGPPQGHAIPRASVPCGLTCTMCGHSGTVQHMLKVIIVLLLIGVVISLFSGLVFLFKDTDRNDSKRTLYALGIRVTLAPLLLTMVPAT